MGISNTNKAVCDICGEVRYSEHKQIDFLKELKEDGWRGSISKIMCDNCASGRRKAGAKYRSNGQKGKEKPVNSAQLIGNLTKDPELKHSGENKIAVCRFTVAVNDRRKNPKTKQWEDNPSFIPVVTFGRQAENCSKYLAKGRKVGVNGKIQTGSYINKDGNKVYTTEIIANNVEFLGGGPQNHGQTAPDGEQDAAAKEQPEAPVPPVPPVDEQYMEGFFPLEDEDIPF